MNYLVVYYSRSGKTRSVAKKIVDVLKCDEEEIVDLKDRSGILGYVTSIYDAIKKKTTEIKPITKNLDSYENIILCSPVWASDVPPAVRTFLNNFKEKIKNISFVATMNIRGAKRMFKELEILSNKKPKFSFSINKLDFITGRYLKKIERNIKLL